MKKNRIYITGPVGSGKTTLAKKISSKLNIKHYEMDDIYWSGSYDVKRKASARNEMIRQVINKKQWILEGVYGREWIRPVLKNSDVIVFLDYPRIILLWRIISRTLRRTVSKEKGKEAFRESWRGFYLFLRAIHRYKLKSNTRGFYKKMRMAKGTKNEVIHIKSRKQSSFRSLA